MALKRKRLLVDKPVQWAIIRQSLLHWICFGFATVVLLSMLQVLPGAGALKSSRELWPAIRSISASVFITFMLLLPIFVLISLKQSNRIVGPVLRLRRALRELAEGKPYTPVVFRTNDFWFEMADDLSRAVERLTQRDKAAQPAAEGQCDLQDERETSLV